MPDVLSRLGRPAFSHRPLVILGHGRSGTTALFGGLIQHPQVLGARSEAPILAQLGRVAYSCDGGETDEYTTKSLAVSKQRFFGELRKTAFESAFGRYGGLVTRLGKVARGDRHPLSKRFWAAKSNFQHEEYLGFCALYPDARFVYIVRNGCEVVRSRTKFKSFSHMSFETHCGGWARSIEGYRYLEGASNTLAVRHEDLVSEPEVVYENIFKLMDLDPCQRSVDYVRANMLHPLDEATKRVDVQQAVAQRPPAHASWTDEQRELFKATCSKAMDVAGYAMPF